jgi:hypothetical protein
MFPPFGVFNPRIFRMLFLLSKSAFICEFQHPLVEIDDFLKVPHLVWA